MKCPRCGYISFDHNEVCPKCKKNIAAERDKLNLPDYRPAPPPVLGALIGEADDYGAGDGNHESGFEQDVGLSAEDSQAIEAMEQTFKDSQDFELQLETVLDEEGEESPGNIDLSDVTSRSASAEIQSRETTLNLAPEEDAEELSLDIEDLPVDDLEINTPQTEQPGDDASVLEPNRSLSGGGGIEDIDIFEPHDDEQEASFDLDDLSHDEPVTIAVESVQEEPVDEEPIDLEGLASGLEERTLDLSESVETGNGEEEEISLDIEDLDLDLDLLDRKGKTS